MLLSSLHHTKPIYGENHNLDADALLHLHDHLPLAAKRVPGHDFKTLLGHLYR